MEYVDLDARVDGLTGVLSPARYLQQLPRLTERLPPGARAFATDPAHYDFAARRCTKDLRLQRLDLPTDCERRDVEVLFRHNCWKHDEDLLVRYGNVAALRVDLPPGEQAAPLAGLGTVVLDEVLPHEAGCSHEVALRPGSLYVVCEDLTATWVAADCPDARRRLVG